MAAGVVKKTIRLAVEHETAKRKGSRFITAAWPLVSGAEAATHHSSQGGGDSAQRQVKALLAQQSAKFPLACHHCYAYTTLDGREFCSDDGEPHNTAGKPILAALHRAQLVDVCIVVSRIFGGTLLGTGGLIRAYGAAAQEVLEHAQIIDKVPTTVLRAKVPFSHIDVVKHACTRFLADIVAQDYESATGADFTLRVPELHVQELLDFLRSKSSGSIRIKSL
uniref:Impact N-terminal domain-containing protein n=1 Tax=Globisporangium ultimum (strain ATCC 200006 / CBS 805.95 / DAOM BR144) TaxID=431595 RepID=K3X9N5_GLOUD